MTSDPFFFRCRYCHTGHDEDVPFCPAKRCEQRYAERRIRRQLAWITVRLHVARVVRAVTGRRAPGR